MQIIVFYEFHKDRLGDSRNIVVIEEVLGQTFGGPVRVEFILGERPKAGNRVPGPELVKSQRQEKEDLTVEKSEDEDIEKAAEEIFGTK